MRQSMRRLAAFAPEDVLPCTGPTAPRKDYPDLEGRVWSVKMCSQRYCTFRKTPSCACCGITGSVMILEWQLRGDGSDPKVLQPHFNLYAVAPDGLALMTKDHILPKSQGGRDSLDNYQTMCELCNSIKGGDHVDVETVRGRRRLYDEHRKGKVTAAELLGRITEEHRDVFWFNVRRSGDGCWPWVGPTPSRGFPRFVVRLRNRVCSVTSRQLRDRRGRKRGLPAYRVAHYLTVGELPQRGVWPVCRNRLCCNPAHIGCG